MKRITILTGENEVLKNEYLGKILLNFNEEEVFKYYLDETEPSHIFSEIESSSLFVSKRIFVLKNFDVCKADVKRQILDYLKEISERNLENVYIVITMEGVYEKDKNENIEVIQFNRIYGKDVIKYVERRLKELGIKFEPEVVEYITEIAMEDVEYIDKMIEIIDSYRDEKIGIDDINKLFDRVGESTPFGFIEGFFSRKPDEAYKALIDLKEKGESIVLINSLLYRTARLLWIYLSTEDEKVLLEKLGIKRFELKKIKKYASNMKLKFLSRVFELVKRVEVLSKTMSPDFAYLELEKFVLSI